MVVPSKWPLSKSFAPDYFGSARSRLMALAETTSRAADAHVQRRSNAGRESARLSNLLGSFALGHGTEAVSVQDFDPVLCLEAN